MGWHASIDADRANSFEHLWRAAGVDQSARVAVNLGQEKFGNESFVANGSIVGRDLRRVEELCPGSMRSVTDAQQSGYLLALSD